jgi:hypothetical protein
MPVRRLLFWGPNMSIVKSGKGFKNESKDGKTFSKKPLTKEKAEKQLKAIEVNKHKKK